MRFLNCSDCADEQLEVKYFELIPFSTITFIFVTLLFHKFTW